MPQHIANGKKPNAKIPPSVSAPDFLPSIRKTGGFQIPQSLPDALRPAANLADENKRLEGQVAEQAPKVEARSGSARSARFVRAGVARLVKDA